MLRGPWGEFQRSLGKSPLKSTGRRRLGTLEMLTCGKRVVGLRIILAKAKPAQETNECSAT